MHILSPVTDNCFSWINGRERIENDHRKYFTINLHKRILPTSAGVEPMTSWSPVGRRIQLSHWGRPILIRLCKHLTESLLGTHVQRYIFWVVVQLLTLCMLRKNFSRQHFEIFLLFFLENRIWHYMQIVSLVCMKCQILFSRKDKKNMTNLYHLLFLPLAWKVLKMLTSLSIASAFFKSNSRAEMR